MIAVDGSLEVGGGGSLLSNQSLSSIVERGDRPSV